MMKLPLPVTFLQGCSFLLCKKRSFMENTENSSPLFSYWGGKEVFINVAFRIDVCHLCFELNTEVVWGKSEVNFIQCSERLGTSAMSHFTLLFWPISPNPKLHRAQNLLLKCLKLRLNVKRCLFIKKKGGVKMTLLWWLFSCICSVGALLILMLSCRVKTLAQSCLNIINYLRLLLQLDTAHTVLPTC